MATINVINHSNQIQTRVDSQTKTTIPFKENAVTSIDVLTWIMLKENQEDAFFLADGKLEVNELEVSRLLLEIDNKYYSEFDASGEASIRAWVNSVDRKNNAALKPDQRYRLQLAHKWLEARIEKRKAHGDAVTLNQVRWTKWGVIIAIITSIAGMIFHHS